MVSHASSNAVLLEGMRRPQDRRMHLLIRQVCHDLPCSGICRQQLLSDSYKCVPALRRFEGRVSGQHAAGLKCKQVKPIKVTLEEAIGCSRHGFAIYQFHPNRVHLRNSQHILGPADPHEQRRLTPIQRPVRESHNNPDLQPSSPPVQP